MELFSTDSHYILKDKDQHLSINRQTCQFSTKDSLIGLNSKVCMGLVYGFIGKIQFGENAEIRLVFIRQRTLVGKLRGCDIFKINSVITIPLGSDSELLLEPCLHHSNANTLQSTSAYSPILSSASDTGTRTGLVKVKTTPLSPSSSHSNITQSPKRQERADKVQKRMLDEFCKMFTEADSFYYSNVFDLTNSIQRQTASAEKLKGKDGGALEFPKFPLWYEADPRFFWNYYMLSDLIQSKVSDFDPWILPIIQGFVQHEHRSLSHLFDPVGPPVADIQGDIDLWIISRRSRFRAGTRYLKRGIDETGKVANYVETEQLMVYKKHIISFVITRGSVPLYWSQPGFRYRPPLRLDKNSDENYSAFRHHIEEEGSIYGPLTLISLLDKSGKEKVLGDAYTDNVVRHNSPNISYFTFDFHDNCRGMHFENVQYLVDKLEDKLREISYCWIDPFGVVQKQNGVCRVNCVDCLDRTNVVESFIGKHVMCTQMSKLGLVSPEFGLPDVVKKTLQTMWANNGDTISKQYAGTSALKGDYTRTGERRIAGALKDGMNSANRYYLNRFRDANRQAVIDISLGIRKNITEDELDADKLIEDRENTAEQIKSVIEDTKKCVIPKFDVVLGSWGLVNAKYNEPACIDVDVVLILTESYYYVTGYDCAIDSITETEKVKLTSVVGIELGYEAANPSSSFLGLFSSNVTQPTRFPTIRISYKNGGVIQFHQFRSSNHRFFNNVAILINHPDEMMDALKLIAETFQIAAISQGNKEMTLTVSGQLLPVKNIKSGSTSTGSTWSNRYLNFGQDVSTTVLEEGARKSITKSFERFTPKYFRRSSAADAARRELEAIRSDPSSQVHHIDDFKNTKEKNSRPPLTIIQGGDSFDIGSVLESCSSHGHLRSRDLVLSSCGVISVPKITLQRSDYPFSPSFLPQTPQIISESGIRYDFDSPITSRHSPEEDSTIIITTPALKRHRYSLPTSSLGVDFRPCSLSPGAPEIKITQEPSRVEGGGSFMSGNIIGSVRLSKSTESVKIPISSSHIPILKQTAGTPSQLIPISGECTRSTSDQDISFSSLGNTMKGSHSDNSIKGSNPFQRFTQNIGNSNPQMFKKDTVLAPLGKIARGVQSIGVNYLHPKKLKDTFKTTPNRKDLEGIKHEDSEENRLLEERKRNCKSLIVSVDL